MLPWSAIKEIDRRPCRIGFPTKRFWDLWKVDKDGVKRMGIEVKKEGEAFVAYWWNPPPDPSTPTRENVPALRFDPNDLPESIRAKLRPYQIEPTLMAIRALKEPPHRFFNASEMGTGKSFQSVAAAMALGMKMVIVSRLAAFPAWKEVATEHFNYRPDEIILINREKLRTGKTGLIAKTVTTDSHGKTHKEWKWTLPANHLLVVDEVHQDNAISSINADMLVAAVDQGLPILALSATGGDEPTRMRAIGYLLGLHKGDEDFYRWMYHNGCQKGENGWQFNFGYARQQILGNNLLRADVEKQRIEVMANIHNTIKRKGVFVRLKRTEIPGFPKNEIIPVALDFNEAQIKEVYREMQSELDSLQRRIDEKKLNPKGLFIEALGEEKKRSKIEIMMRARQRTELLKIPGLVEEVQDILDEGGSCPIFLNFKDSVRALAERLDTRCIFDGDTNPTVRENNRLKYQRDDERKIILNTQCGGESIGLHDLHGNYPRTALVMPTFWLNLLLQTFGRINRDGGKTPSVSKLIFAVGTVEEDAYKSCKQRKKQADAFNGEWMPTEEDLQAGLKL